MLLTLPSRPAPAQAGPASCKIDQDRQAAIAGCTGVIADATLPASVRAQALVRRAMMYSMLSAVDFNTAMEIDPANPEIRKDRARHHAASGRSDQAIADYNEAIRLDPNDSETYRARGDAWLMQKKYSEAFADYRRSIDLKPVDPRRAFDQCRVSASWTNAIFHCFRVADDTNEPAETRADAQRRLDRMTGAGRPAR
jgi:tetratricopeptide (TPR) repeat protein